MRRIRAWWTTIRIALVVGALLAVGIAGVVVADADDAHPLARFPSNESPAADPNVSLAAVSVPETVANDSDYRLGVELDNDADTSVAVTLRYDGEGDGGGPTNRTVRIVTVPPGGTNVTVNLTAPTQAGSTVEHRIAVAGDEWTGETRVRSPARFVPSITIDPGSGRGAVTADAPVTVLVDVQNRGGIAGTKTVRLIADGEPIRNVSLTLEPGEWRKITEEIVPSITGMYGILDVTVVAGDVERTASISAHATPTRTPTATATPAERSTTSTVTVTRTGTGTETRARTTVTPGAKTDDPTSSPGATTRHQATADATSGEATPGFGVVAVVLAVVFAVLVVVVIRQRKRA